MRIGNSDAFGFEHGFESASRRRAEAALWRAAQAGGAGAFHDATADHESFRTRDSVLECGGPPPLGNRRLILMAPI